MRAIDVIYVECGKLTEMGKIRLTLKISAGEGASDRMWTYERTSAKCFSRLAAKLSLGENELN